MNWRAASGEAGDVPEELEVPSVDVPEMYNRILLLEKNAGWIQDVGSVNSRLVEMWEKYQGTLVALILSVSRTPLEVVTICR